MGHPIFSLLRPIPSRPDERRSAQTKQRLGFSLSNPHEVLLRHRREKAGEEEMASLSRTAAAAAVAVRSAVRSAPLTGRVLGAPLPSLASPSAARSARILRRSAATASAGLETLMPLHSAVAAARLRSCIAVDSTCWSSLSQV
ncbi:unnamed protein product [Miscanthus lutarioriparius]|uniref:Uncharacterized protein n=1 Tax=Miscanthus lutarioriparius TaxID=422564 RepID=A0A811QN40_9POAL|nr:unnamed protein product [Miscanthus lutarioriparius]